MKLVRLVNLVFQSLVRFGVLKIAADVVDALGDAIPEFHVDRRGSVLGNFLAEHLAEALGGEIIGGEADDGELLGKKPVLSEIAEGGDELALGEVAGGAKNNHHAGRRGGVHFQMIQAHEKGFLSSCVNGFLKALVPGLLFDVPAELEAHRR